MFFCTSVKKHAVIIFLAKMLRAKEAKVIGCTQNARTYFFDRRTEEHILGAEVIRGTQNTQNFILTQRAQSDAEFNCAV